MDVLAIDTTDSFEQRLKAARDVRSEGIMSMDSLAPQVAARIKEEWTPPIEDDSGYRITRSDLEFLGLSASDATAFQRRDSPLGMTSELFSRFRTGLFRALDEDGISDAEVRLKGSSASFFSGAHKSMPITDRDLVAEFRAEYDRRPRRDELEYIKQTLDTQWPKSSAQPLRRPFNSLYLLRVHRSPSDYDLQISSDEIFERSSKWVEDRGWSDVVDLEHDTYSFIDKEIVALVCPAIEDWRVTATQFLRFSITIAAFPLQGPPNFENSRTKKKRLMSSHHRSTDWVLNRDVPMTSVEGQR